MIEQATAEAIATATASAFAKTSTQVTGDDCDNAFAKGKAQAEGFAKAVAEAIATASAEAYNKNQRVFSGTRGREIEVCPLLLLPRHPHLGESI